MRNSYGCQRRLVARGLTAGLAVLAVGLGGCASLTGAPDRPVDPPWVIQPPPDTAYAFFGVGEGVDLAAAKRAALRDIAARLRVSISGVLTSQTTVNGSQLNRSQSSRISEEVQLTEFRNPVLRQSAASPQGVYALVEVDRTAFMQQTRERILQLFERVQQLSADPGRQTPLERFALWQQAMPLLAQIQAQQALLPAGELTTEDRQRQATVVAWQRQADASMAALVVALRHAPDEADVAALFSQYLTRQGLRLASTPEQANAWLELSGTQRSDFVRPATVVRLSVRMQLRDPASHRVIASREQQVSGNSLIDTASARQQALLKLQQQLESVGLAEVFGWHAGTPPAR